MNVSLRFFLLVVGILFAAQFFGQENIAPAKFALSLTPQLGGLVSTEDFAKSKFGFGIKAEAVYRFTLRDGLHFVLGPSFQWAEVANRANNLRWPDDHQNGMWVPGLSYEEYNASFISLGGTAELQFAFPRNKSNWLAHAGTGLRYVLDYDDKLTINESGHINNDLSEQLLTEINKGQFFVDFGISYLLKVSEKRKISIGPEIEYGVVNFLRSAEPTVLWTYHAAFPLFLGLRVTAY